MSEFIRNTAYLSLYENGRPIRGIGFVKRTRRFEDDKLLVHINGFYTTGSAAGRIYAIVERGDHDTAVAIGTVMIDNNEGECRLVLPQEISGHIGIAVIIEEQECIGWYDGSMNGSNIEYPKEKDRAEAEIADVGIKDAGIGLLRETDAGIGPSGKTEEEQGRNESKEKKQVQESNREGKEGGMQDEAAWEQLKQVFPIVYPFEYVVEADYLSITPNEIRQLDASEHILLNNSFLQHAYYNYKYLIIGKKHREQEESKSETGEEAVYYIGVPGIYHDREIMMAKMFGFEHFLSAKKEQPNMGCFGYYMKQVKI